MDSSGWRRRRRRPFRRSSYSVCARRRNTFRQLTTRQRFPLWFYAKRGLSVLLLLRIVSSVAVEWSGVECPFAYYNNIIIGNWRSPDRDGSLFRHSTTDRRRRAGGNPVVPHPPPHLNIDYIPNVVHRHGYYNLEECLLQCLQRGIRLLRRAFLLILNSFIARIKIHPPYFMVLPQSLANCCTTCLSEQRIIILLFKRASEQSNSEGATDIKSMFLGSILASAQK